MPNWVKYGLAVVFGYLLGAYGPAVVFGRIAAAFQAIGAALGGHG
jgi:hypothetical protein